MRRLPSASQLERAFHCAPSETLPHMQSTGEYAERGIDVHSFMETADKFGRDTALARIAALCDEGTLSFCDAIPLDELPTGGDHEIAVAWNHVTDTARALPKANARDYADVHSNEFVGTADYMGRDGDAVVVLDYKTGHKNLGPAKRSRQLRMLALSGARLVGADTARAGYVYLREDGTHATAWATFDAFDLAEIADEMRALAATLAGEDDGGGMHEGDWCDYCPAFNSCPAKTRLALAIGSGDAHRELASIERRVEAMTDSELATAYSAIERYDDIAERVRKTIRQRAAMHPVDLGDGRELGTVQWPFTVVKAEVAYETVREMHGDAAAELAVPRSATVTAIKKLGKETLAEIERRRGVVTGSKPQVRVHKK